MAIKDNIKKLRERYGLTQQKLADIAGVTNKAVSAWESGLSEPRMGAIERISNHFGIKKGDIIDDGGIDNLKVSTHDLLRQDEKFSEREDYFNLELLDSLSDLFTDKRLQPVSKARIENGIQKKLEELYEEHKIKPNTKISDQILIDYVDYPNIKIIPDYLLKEVLAIKGTQLKKKLRNELESLYADYKLEVLKEEWEGNYKNENDSRNIIKLEDIIEQGNISYKGRQLTNPERLRILNMLEILFPEN